MRNDLELIIKHFPKSQDRTHLYALGPELQYLELYTKREKRHGETTVHKVINYHSIQI